MPAIAKYKLAIELGVSPGRISQYIASGMPVRPDGKVDHEVALQWAADNARSTVARSGGATSYMEARRRKELAIATLRELEVGEAQGRLVELSAVTSGMAAVYSIVRNQFLGLATKLAPRVAAMKSAEEVRDLIDGEVRNVLNAIASSPYRGDDESGVCGNGAATSAKPVAVGRKTRISKP